MKIRGIILKNDSNALTTKYSPTRIRLPHTHLPLHLFVVLSKIAFVEMMFPYLQKRELGEKEDTHTVAASPIFVSRLRSSSLLLTHIDQIFVGGALLQSAYVQIGFGQRLLALRCAVRSHRGVCVRVAEAGAQRAALRAGIRRAARVCVAGRSGGRHSLAVLGGEQMKCKHKSLTLRIGDNQRTHAHKKVRN